MQADAGFQIIGLPSIREQEESTSHPSQSKCDDEDQRIGGNVQIKSGQTVQQDGGHTSDATKTNSSVKANCPLSGAPDGKCEDPKNPTKHPKSSRQPKFTDQ